MGASEAPVQRKLLASFMHATHVTDTRRHFPEVSPPRIRLQVQTQEEDPVSGSTFPGIEEISKDALFMAIEFEKPEEGLGCGGDDSDDDLFEVSVWLDNDVIDLPPPLHDMWAPVEDRIQ